MAQSNLHKGSFSITDLVKELSIDKDLIRHYESKGLVSAKSTTLNQRVYSQVDEIRLKFITQARHADYSLQEIESLIGTVSPHLTEADEIKESLFFAEKKFNTLRAGLKELDALDQMNITCDLELLNRHIVELNSLRAEKHLNRHAKKGPQEEKTPPPLRVTEQSKEPPTVNWSNRDMAFIAASQRSKKPYIIATVFISALLAGFLILKSDFFGTKITPVVTQTSFADKDDGQLEQSEVSEDGVFKSPSERKMKDVASNNSHAGTEGVDRAILPLKGATADASRSEQPQAELLDMDAPGQPTDSFASTQAVRVPSEAPELELMKNVIKDMAAKYNAQPGESTMSTAVAEKDGGEDLDLQNDLGTSDAFVVASNSSMGAAHQEVTKNKPVSGLTESVATVTDTQPKKSQIKTSKKKETRATTAKQQSQKTSTVPKASQPETKQVATPVVVLPPASAKQETPVSEGDKKAGKTTSDSKEQIAQKRLPENEGKQQDVGKSGTPKKNSADQSSKAPPKSEPSARPRSRTMAATESGSVAEASKKASNSAAQEWIRSSRQNRKSGNVSDTIVAATVAISIDPALASPYLDRAWAYASKGLYEKAIEDTSRAIEIEPNSALAYMTKADAYQAVGQTSKARAAYERACTLGSGAACTQKEILRGGDSIEGLLRQSRQDFKKRDWNAVIATSSEVLKLDPDNVIAYANRSAAFLQKGAFERAIADCNEALKIDPGYSLAFNNRGYALERLGKQKDAEQDYKKACSLGLKLGCKNYEKF